MSARQFFRDEARVDISCPASGVLIGDTSYKIPLCPPPAPAIPYYQRIAAVPLNANQYACIVLVELFLFIWMSQDFLLSFIGLWVSRIHGHTRIDLLIFSALLLLLNAVVLFGNVQAAKYTFQSGGSIFEAGLNGECVACEVGILRSVLTHHHAYTTHHTSISIMKG
jgi:hypothetical protein